MSFYPFSDDEDSAKVPHQDKPREANAIALNWNLQSAEAGIGNATEEGGGAVGNGRRSVGPLPASAAAFIGPPLLWGASGLTCSAGRSGHSATTRCEAPVV